MSQKKAFEEYKKILREPLQNGEIGKKIMLFLAEYFSPLWNQFSIYVVRAAVANEQISREKAMKAIREAEIAYESFKRWIEVNVNIDYPPYILEKLKEVLDHLSTFFTKTSLKEMHNILKEKDVKNISRKIRRENIMKLMQDTIMANTILMNILAIHSSSKDADVLFPKKRMDRFKQSLSYQMLVKSREDLDNQRLNDLFSNIIRIYDFLSKGCDSDITDFSDTLKTFNDAFFRQCTLTLAEIKTNKTRKDWDILRSGLSELLDNMIQGNASAIKNDFLLSMQKLSRVLMDVFGSIIIEKTLEKALLRRRKERLINLKKFYEKKKETPTHRILNVKELGRILDDKELLALFEEPSQQETPRQPKPSPPPVVMDGRRQDVVAQQQRQQQLTVESFFNNVFRDRYPVLGKGEGAQAQYRGRQKKEIVYRDNTQRLITALSGNAIWQNLLHDATSNVYFLDMANILKTLPQWKDSTFSQRQNFILTQYTDVPDLLQRNYLNRSTGEPIKRHDGNELYVLFGQKDMDSATDDIISVNQPDPRFIIILVGCFDHIQNRNCFEDVDLKNEMDDFALLYTASQMVRYRANLLYSIDEKESELQGTFAALGRSMQYLSAMRRLKEYAKQKRKQIYHIVSNDRYKRKRLRYTLAEEARVFFYEFPVRPKDRTTDEELRVILRENISEGDVRDIPGELMESLPFPCYALVARLIPDEMIRNQVLEILDLMEM